MVYQHIAFTITFRNVDAADPRCGTETVLSFSGVRFEEGDEAKDVAIMHCAFNVTPNADIIAEFGKIWPIPRTFVLNGIHTPSDQALGR